jgi:hypothetical protein
MMLATRRTAEEKGVEGKTFHAYSIPMIIAILGNVRWNGSD